MSILAPSLLSANFLRLEEEVMMLNQSEADWLHLDIMDGVFVPNISLGFPAIEQLARITTLPLDAHLMIVQPEKFITRFRDTGVQLLSVHYEACPHLHSVVSQIKAAGMKASVTLNPHTPIEVLTDILPDLDMVLLMSVNPGFGGQKFIEHSYDKVRRLKQLITAQGLSTLIEVDGGINLERGAQMTAAGVDVLVVGNAIFNTPNPAETIRRFKAGADPDGRPCN
jgi:ribulose-phosphate 3-epimerase